jgi:molybdopterin synthase sulfur carrier subunit
MQIKLYASLRQAAGTKMIEVDAGTGTTIREVLLEVTRRYPVLEKLIWKDQGELSEQAHVFINGENISHRARLDTNLTEMDHVDIFPPLVGGSAVIGELLSCLDSYSAEGKQGHQVEQDGCQGIGGNSR